MTTKCCSCTVVYITHHHYHYHYCINNSLHLARKHVQIFVCGHHLFREANSFPRAFLDENCGLRGTDNVQVKWRLLCLLSFKSFSQLARF